MLAVLRDATDGLARAASADLQLAVPSYPGWSVADLVVHTGRIHRWVTHIVKNRATTRPPQPDLDERPDDLVGWFRTGAAAVADTLAAVGPAVAVWTFAGEPSVRFWRRRMALETTIHRWDAQIAVGDAAAITDEVAAAGVTEALEIYLEPRTRDTAVGGTGEVAVLATADGARAWAVRLHSDAIEVVNADQPGDVRITAPSDQLWLFLMGRVASDALDVHGPVTAVDRLERAVASLLPPQR
ncbi:maleylpyruvate isomerase family mycothiol-dependent enzyme [soil metagenome]